MQETTLHFLTNSKSSFFFSSHHDLSSFSSRSLHFPSLSAKAQTLSLPQKPPLKLTETSPPPPSPPPPTPPQPPSDFQEKILYLDSIGIDIFTLINDHSRQLDLSSSLTDIKSTVDFLISMSFSTIEIRRIISMCPEILNSNAASLLPIFTFLLREAKVSGSHIKHVINRRPRLLVSNIKYRLRPTLYFLQSIGISEVSKHTYLLSCSVEDKLIPKIEYFEKIGFSFKDAKSMFRRFPALFNYSVKENLEPKLNYLVVEMGRDLKEVKEFPHYFSFSLEKRIKPRHQCCVGKGVYFPLNVLLKTTESRFRERLEVCCSSSVPLSSSPLASVNSDGYDTHSSIG